MLPKFYRVSYFDHLLFDQVAKDINVFYSSSRFLRLAIPSPRSPASNDKPPKVAAFWLSASPACGNSLASVSAFPDLTVALVLFTGLTSF